MGNTIALLPGAQGKQDFDIAGNSHEGGAHTCPYLFPYPCSSHLTWDGASVTAPIPQIQTSFKAWWSSKDDWKLVNTKLMPAPCSASQVIQSVAKLLVN